MATRKDIELAERFLTALENELAVWEKLFKGYPSKIIANFQTENSAIRALIAHAKQTIPAEPQPPAFDNPANADDYNTLHDYFDRGGK